MLTPETAAMSGPDQLDALADQTEGQGLQVTAESLRQMAREWRSDRRERDEACSSLAIAAHPSRHQPIPRRGHAITPTAR